MKPNTVVLAAAAAAGIAVIVYGVYAGFANRRRMPAPDPKIEAAKRQAEAEATAAYNTALDALLATPIAITNEPCTATPPRAPMKLGDMSLAWPGDRFSGKPGDDTQGYLMGYVRFTGSDVAIVPRAESGAPFEKVIFGVADATLVIDRWLDPIVPDMPPPAKFAAGQLEGHVVIWDRAAKKFACAAKVTASNTDVTVVTTTRTGRDFSTTKEDTLSKVRVDLVNEAIRAGLANPTTIR